MCIRDRLDSVKAVTAGETGTELVVEDFSAVPEIIKTLVSNGVEVQRVEPVSHSLEELYFAVRKERRAQMGETNADEPIIGERRESVDA